MVFAIVIPRRPPSGNKGPNRKFQEEIRAGAKAKFGGRPLLTGDLYVRITWFHNRPTSQDIDNIAKNILDAIKGVVYQDDVQIVQCLACKINMAKGFAIVDRTVPPDIFDELLSLLAKDQDHILCVEVGNAVAGRVVFGPIDGGRNEDPDRVS